jgi:hypothetical protein
MAHFRATIKGQRGGASRLGSPKSGIVADVNGWDSGVRIETAIEKGEDVFYVYVTGGSNGATSPYLAGKIYRPMVEGKAWEPSASAPLSFALFTPFTAEQ